MPRTSEMGCECTESRPIARSSGRRVAQISLCQQILVPACLFVAHQRGTESAEFFVLLASDGNSKAFKVEDVKFISGSGKMKLQGKQLKTIDFDVPAPDNLPTRFVRRGILGCYQYSGCSFALLDPASVDSLN